MSKIKSIRWKILLPVLVMTFLLIGITLTVSTLYFSRYVDLSLQKALEAVMYNTENEIDQLKSDTLNQLIGIAARDDFVEALTEVDRVKIRSVFERSNLMFSNPCDYYTVLDPEGYVLFRTNDPESTVRDFHGNLTCVKRVLRDKNACVSFDSTNFVKVGIRGAVPVYTDDGDYIGIVCGGFKLSTNEWVDSVKERHHVDCTIFEKDNRVATTLEKDGARYVDYKLENPVRERKVLVEKQKDFDDATLFGVRMKVAYSPLVDIDGNATGILFCGIPSSEGDKAVRANLLTNIGIAVLLLGLTLCTFTVILNRITGPIQSMTEAAEELSKGKFDVRMESIRTGDELERLGNAFRAVAASLKEKTDVALAISKGDLTVWVPLSSEEDTLGNALVEMRYGLFDSIKDLGSLASTVANEGEQLQRSTRTLVENTVRSADQLQNVDSLLRELDSKTEQNAANAKEADSIAVKTQKSSEEGKEKMALTVKAMEAITRSASEINKIIKVIDDIAFQTNLLALNAAVEAARAGVHGKGFAVVAEEVRNLASRSAKAAQETEELIQESIRQVEGGSRMANDTAESLNEIVDYAESVGSIISKISAESAQQMQSLRTASGSVGEVTIAANENTQSVNEASSAISSISSTAQGLKLITQNFKCNDSGKVTPPKNTNYIKAKITQKH